MDGYTGTEAGGGRHRGEVIRDGSRLAAGKRALPVELDGNDVAKRDAASERAGYGYIHDGSCLMD